MDYFQTDADSRLAGAVRHWLRNLRGWKTTGAANP